jgi:hypothetical protein
LAPVRDDEVLVVIADGSRTKAAVRAEVQEQAEEAIAL